MRERIRQFVRIMRTPDPQTTANLELSLSELSTLRGDSLALRADVSGLSRDLAIAMGSIGHIVAQVDTLMEFMRGVNHRTDVTERAVILIREQLLTTNHHTVVTQASVHDLQADLSNVVDQIALERETILASNDNTRRRLQPLSEAFETLVNTQRALPHLAAALSRLDQAQGIVGAAQSQYKDPIPSDASSFAPMSQ